MPAPTPENKHVVISSKHNCFYREFVSEPSMIVLFDSFSGRQIGNYDKETFERSIKNGNSLEFDNQMLQSAASETEKT